MPRFQLNRRFIEAKSGATAVVFGLSVVVLVGFVGASIDIGRATSIRAGLQGALDAAVLAGANAQSAGQDGIETAIRNDIKYNWTDKHLSYVPSLDFSDLQDGKLAVVASTDMPTSFLSVMGMWNMHIRVGSEVQYGAKNAEIALVLDNTFSMTQPLGGGNRLDALKSAANVLLDTISVGGAHSESLKIGIAPFSQYVNVGLQYRNEPWLSVPPDQTVTTHECWNTWPNSTPYNCHPETWYNDGVPYEGQHCDYTVSDPVEQCADVQRVHEWKGCVGSRNSPLDTDVVADAANPYPGILDLDCTAPITRLTSDIDDIRAKVGLLNATGETYIPAGLLWGWTLLSHRSPLADGVDPAVKPQVKKILVLMTDGENTKSATYPLHDGGENHPLVDGLTSSLCDKIEADGIEIFTVAFDVENANSVAMLNACASAHGGSFSADDASELANAFQLIGKSIVALRLTK